MAQAVIGPVSRWHDSGIVGVGPGLWYGPTALDGAAGDWKRAPLGSIYVQVDAAGTTTSTWQKTAKNGTTADWTPLLDSFGVSGGKTIAGGTGANEDLTLRGTSHATKTTSYVLLQPDGGNVGVNTSTPGAALHVAGTAKIDTYAAIGASLNTTVTLNLSGTASGAYLSSYYGLRNAVTITAGASCAVYNAAATTSGSTNGDHFVGFQTASTHASTGTLARMMGFYAGDTVSAGCGTLAQYRGLEIRSPAGTGVITLVQGVYIADVAGRGTTSWGLYVDGTSQSYFGGNVVMAEGANIKLGTTTGTKIGTGATEKLGFYGATPIVKQTGVAVTAEGIHAALVTLGLIAA